MNEVVVHDDLAQRLFPRILLLDYETSVRLAFEKIRSAKLRLPGPTLLHRVSGPAPVAFPTSEGMVIERRQRVVTPRRGRLSGFRASGWAKRLPLYGLDMESAGIVDRLFGGVGMRRGRRHSTMCGLGMPSTSGEQGFARAQAASAPGRNESARPCLARVSRRTSISRKDNAYPDCVFRAEGSPGTSLLVRALSGSCPDFQRTHSHAGKSGDGN